MHKRRKLSIAAAIAAISLGLAGCTGDPASPGDEEATLSMAVVTPTAGQGFNFSPGYSDYDSILVRPVYEFILSYTTDDEGLFGYGPGVATEWEFAEDFSSVTLKVREDTTFSDGTPVDADAVAKNVQYWIDTEEDINWGRFASSATVIDEYTVEIGISEAARTQGATQIQTYMATTPFMSPVGLEDPEKLASEPIGSAAYVLDQDATTEGVSYTFTKRDDYWNADAYAYDEIVIKLYPDGVGAVNALRSGQVDFAPVDAATAPEIEASGFDLLKTAGAVRGLMLGDKGGDILKPMADVRVRQAINMAFDRDAIAKNLEGGYAMGINQPFVEGFPQYLSDQLGVYPYDPEGARALLAEAGYPDGFDMVLPTYTDHPSLTKYDPIVKQALEDIGIRVTFETTDWYTAVTEPKFAATNNYIGSAVAQQFYLAHKGLFNPWEYQDPKMDELISTYNFGSEEERSEVAAEIGQYALDSAWMALITAPYTLFAYSADVEVVSVVPPLGSPPEFHALAPARD